MRRSTTLVHRSRVGSDAFHWAPGGGGVETTEDSFRQNAYSSVDIDWAFEQVHLLGLNLVALRNPEVWWLPLTARYHLG